VDRVQLRAENFADAVQVMQIAAREIAAGVAAALLVERAQRILVRGVADLDVAEPA